MSVPNKLFSYFSTNLYVVGTQKNRLSETPKHMFKLITKEYFIFLRQIFA